MARKRPNVQATQSKHGPAMAKFGEHRFRPFCVNPTTGRYIVLDTLDGITIQHGDPNARYTFEQAVNLVDRLNEEHE